MYIIFVYLYEFSRVAVDGQTVSCNNRYREINIYLFIVKRYARLLYEEKLLLLKRTYFQNDIYNLEINKPSSLKNFSCIRIRLIIARYNSCTTVLAVIVIA